MSTNRTITDIHGVTTTIHDYETYTVVYADESGRVNVADDIYWNYPGDDHLGQDDDEGRGPSDCRIYFDGVKDTWGGEKKVMKVMTSEEWQKTMKEMFA